MNARELIMLIESLNEFNLGFTNTDSPSILKQADVILHLKYNEGKKNYTVDNIDLTDEIKKTKNWEKLKKILETMKEMNIGSTLFYNKEQGEESVEINLIKLEGIYRMRVEEQKFNLDALLKNSQFKSYLERQVLYKL